MSQEGQSVTKSTLREQSLTCETFEELFSNGMLGSRWMGYEEVQNLYRSHKILDSSETIIIHAQQY